MRAITALLLLCVSAFSFAAPAEEPQSNGNDQLAQLLFNDPNSPRTGAKEPKLTIVSFTDYNCPYCWALHQRLMAKKGYHDDASIAAAQKKTATDSVNIDDKTMDSLKMNLILSQVLNIQGTPATIIGDQMVAGAIPADELEGLVKEQLAKARGQ